MGEDISDRIDMSSYTDTGLQVDHECKLQTLHIRWQDRCLHTGEL